MDDRSSHFAFIRRAAKSESIGANNTGSIVYSDVSAQALGHQSGLAKHKRVIHKAERLQRGRRRIAPRRLDRWLRAIERLQQRILRRIHADPINRAAVEVGAVLVDQIVKRRIEHGHLKWLKSGTAHSLVEPAAHR